MVLFLETQLLFLDHNAPYLIISRLTAEQYLPKLSCQRIEYCWAARKKNLIAPSGIEPAPSDFGNQICYHYTRALDTKPYRLACLIWLTYTMGNCLTNTGRPSIIEQVEGQSLSMCDLCFNFKKIMSQTEKYIAPRRGGEVAILWPRTSRYSTTAIVLRNFFENFRQVSTPRKIPGYAHPYRRRKLLSRKSF